MMDQQQGSSLGWDSLPPELLRRVVQHLLKDWLYVLPATACGSLLPVRATCKAWRAVLDADTTHLGLTVPLQSSEHLADHFPNADSLDLSRYQHSCQEVFPVFQRLSIRALVLADPWDPPSSIPTQHLTGLTQLCFLAEGLVVPHITTQFCQAVVRLTALRELQLIRLQLPAQMSVQGMSQQLGHTLATLPHLSRLALSGGAAPVAPGDLYMLLNVTLPGLRDLELTRLGVRTLPLSLTRLANLTRLAFSGEMLRNVQIRDEIRQLKHLQVLDISANLAEQLPSGVLDLTSLRELHAGMNRLGMHMHSLSRLQHLQVLVLASNKLLAVHPSLWDLTGLLHLDLGHNNLPELPQDVSQLTALTYLSVCHNFLTVLPAGLSCLVDLVELDVSLNTDMRELPAGLGQLALLTRLTASHMRLKQLPLDMGGLLSLQHLDVSHNSLHHLTPHLSCLGQLTHLEASDNKLHQSAAVPEELASLTALRVLRLARNRLQSLPEALGCYSQLQVLDCTGNRLTSVPRVVGRCSALQQLLMASNRLRGLTSGIGNLVRLQVLDLSHNQYRHLPTMTGDLTQLQSLLLEDNQLEDLPSSCSALVKLTSLTLGSNRLHVLPPAVSRMSGLMNLTLADNPLLGRNAVVLQLQRQLPNLKVDDLEPLQAVKPARMEEVLQQHMSSQSQQLLAQLNGRSAGSFAPAAGASSSDHSSAARQAGLAGAADARSAGSSWLSAQQGNLVQLAQRMQQVFEAAHGPGNTQPGNTQQDPEAGQQPHQQPALRLAGGVSRASAVTAAADETAAAAPAAACPSRLHSPLDVDRRYQPLGASGTCTDTAIAAAYNPFPWQQLLAQQRQQVATEQLFEEGSSSSVCQNRQQAMAYQLLDDQKSDEDDVDVDLAAAIHEARLALRLERQQAAAAAAGAAPPSPAGSTIGHGNAGSSTSSPLQLYGEAQVQHHQYAWDSGCRVVVSSSPQVQVRPSYLEIAAARPGPLVPCRLVPDTRRLLACVAPGSPLASAGAAVTAHLPLGQQQQVSEQQQRRTSAAVPGLCSGNAAASSNSTSVIAVHQDNSTVGAAAGTQLPAMLVRVDFGDTATAPEAETTAAAGGDVDDVCSAGGLESGSEDSGSLDAGVSARVGDPVLKLSSTSCSQGGSLELSANAGDGQYAQCRPEAASTVINSHLAALSLAASHIRDNSDCTSSGGGAAATDQLMAGAVRRLGISRCTSSGSNGMDDAVGSSLTGGAPDVGVGPSSMALDSCAAPIHDATAAICSTSSGLCMSGSNGPGPGGDGQAGAVVCGPDRAGDRSFTLGVLESAWWGGDEQTSV